MEIIKMPQAIDFDHFSLLEYISKVKVSDANREYAADTLKEYLSYMKNFFKYDYDIQNLFLIYSFNEEIKESNLIENHLIYPEEVLKGDYYIDNFNVSHDRIKELHDFIQRGTDEYDYRSIPAWVQKVSREKKIIFWYGAKPEDINKFMDEFIELYKIKNLSNNIFLECMIIHLLFMKIHPFKDGNGRTARLLTNIKFAEVSNRLFDSDLKISPLHLSHSVYRNRDTYNQRLNAIYFDLEHDINESVNKYIKYMLDMYNEQLFYMDNLLKRSETALYNAMSMKMSGISNEDIIKTLVL